MTFYLAIGVVAVILFILGARFAAAEGRYDTAVRRKTERPAQIATADSPIAMMRAVNADLADRSQLDRLVASGALDDPIIQELYGVRTTPLRQAILAGAVSMLLILPAAGLVAGMLGR